MVITTVVVGAHLYLSDEKRKVIQKSNLVAHGATLIY